MSFYSGSSTELKYLEEAILMEDIELPELPPFPTHLEVTLETVYYPRPIELYTDMKGKFSITILNPLNNSTDSPVDNTKGSTSVRNIVNKDCNISVSSYQESNYVTLNIPKYILLNFVGKVPKGTKFIVGFIGGSTDVEDIRIIGVA